MSFRGLQKAANRALTTVLVAAGAVDKTIDVEFESLETCFKKLESEIDALFTCSKNLLDATRLLSASSCRISANVDSLYQDGAALASLSLLFSSAIDNVDKQFRADLDADYRLCVLDLLGRFAALFPEYNETIKKRSKKLLDYDGLRGNVKKLADKPANDSSKLPKAEQEANAAKAIYDQVNNQLKEDIPKLINMKNAYLEPVVESSVKCQREYAQKVCERLQSLERQFEAANVGDMDSALNRIRALSICN